MQLNLFFPSYFFLMLIFRWFKTKSILNIKHPFVLENEYKNAHQLTFDLGLPEIVRSLATAHHRAMRWLLFKLTECKEEEESIETRTTMKKEWKKAKLKFISGILIWRKCSGRRSLKWEINDERSKNPPTQRTTTKNKKKKQHMNTDRAGHTNVALVTAWVDHGWEERENYLRSPKWFVILACSFLSTLNSRLLWNQIILFCFLVIWKMWNSIMWVVGKANGKSGGNCAALTNKETHFPWIEFIRV